MGFFKLGWVGFFFGWLVLGFGWVFLQYYFTFLCIVTEYLVLTLGILSSRIQLFFFSFFRTIPLHCGILCCCLVSWVSTDAKTQRKKISEVLEKGANQDRHRKGPFLRPGI